MSLRPIFTPASLLIVGVVIVLWVSALLLPLPQQKEPLRVAVGTWPGAEPWIMAREAGELPVEEINLVEMNWTSAAMRAVGNRVVDAAVLSLDEAIRQIQQGYALKIVMVTDISRGADVLIAKNEVKSVQDLKGGRVGYEPRTSGAWLLNKALQNSNLKLSDVHAVPLNPAEVDEIFEEMALDGVVLSEPWKQRMRDFNLRSVYDSSIPGAEVVRVLVVNPEILRSHREALIKLMQAHFKWTAALENGGEVLRPVLRREGVPLEVFQQIVSKIEIMDKERNRQLLSVQDPWLAERFKTLQKSLAKNPDSGMSPEAEEVFDVSLVEDLP